MSKNEFVFDQGLNWRIPGAFPHLTPTYKNVSPRLSLSLSLSLSHTHTHSFSPLVSYVAM